MSSTPSSGSSLAYSSCSAGSVRTSPLSSVSSVTAPSARLSTRASSYSRDTSPFSSPAGTYTKGSLAGASICVRHSRVASPVHNGAAGWAKERRRRKALAHPRIQRQTLAPPFPGPPGMCAQGARRVRGGGVRACAEGCEKNFTTPNTLVAASLPWVVCFLSFFLLRRAVLPSLPWVVCFLSYEKEEIRAVEEASFDGTQPN